MSTTLAPTQAGTGTPVGAGDGHGCRLTAGRAAGVRVVSLEGRLDWTNACEYRELMRDLPPEPAVVVDLGGLSGLDSAGTGMLIASAVRARRNRQQMVVVVSDPFVGAVLSSTGLDTMVPVVASLPEALLWLEDAGFRPVPDRTGP